MTETRERDFDFTLTRDDGDGLTFEGYAAVFNTPARIRDVQGEYDEVIAPGAFNKTIQGRKPLFMFNHGKHPVWADLPIGTITEMREDPQGLFIQARMLSHDFFAPLREAIHEKAIPGMSFRFDPRKGRDQWQTRGRGEPRLCVRKEVCVPELGPVISPAYVETTASVRSICSSLERSFPGAVSLGSTRDGVEVETETDPQELVTDAVAKLWGVNGDNLNGVEFHDTYMVFYAPLNDVSDHRGLWQVNYSYTNGTVTIQEPFQVQAQGYIPKGIGAKPPTDLPPRSSNLTATWTERNTDLGTSSDAAPEGTSVDAATQVRTGPTTQAERQQQIRQIQLARRGITRKDVA